MRQVAFRTWLCWLILLLADTASRGEDTLPAADGNRTNRKIVLIAGTKSHGPGHHEYEKGMRVVKYCLDHAPNLQGLRTEIHLDGWPKDEKTLDDADTIVMFCDGSDHDVAAHPLLRSDHLETIRKQMQRGCGFVAIHYTVFVPIARGGEDLLNWIGGFFDYESGPEPRRWYSKIQAATTTPKPATPDHPINRGMAPFDLLEEYYYNIRFRASDPRLTPILTTSLPNEPKEEVIAWAVERPDGGRGFGFTGGHFHDNWKVANFRRMILNAIVWTAGIEVPPGGVQSTMPTEAQLAEVAIGTPIRTLLLTGHQHPGHLWKQTTPALKDVLRTLDPRFEIQVEEDPEFLAKGDLSDVDVILFNYCNWQRPGLSRGAKEKFVRYLQQGGGLSILHFANGAFHFSLPDTPASDWPEWRTKICRRVWDHTAGKSGHDAYGTFTVDITETPHPITAGLKAFPTVDELYFRQEGEEPIEVLATARSQVTGKHEPMAFVYDYGKGRVFQTVLGHAEESIRTPGTAALIARGTAWAAGREPAAVMPEQPITADPLSPSASVVPGRFGKGIDLRKGGLEIPHLAEYQTPPLTVECWAKLASKNGFNILLAKNPKESADHWEIYTYAGKGDFSAYLPGYAPAEIRSGVDICDNHWHHVAMTFDGNAVALFVDGKRTTSTSVQRVREGGPTGPLWIGMIPPGLGCDGLIDDVRLSKSLRSWQAPPDGALAADTDTIGLWSFEQIDKDGRVDDASPKKNPAKLGLAIPTAQVKDHFGEEEVGFRWTEDDSRDDRWKEMDTGPFFSGTIATPEAPTYKGIVVRVGEDRQASLCYDTDLLRVSAAWSGGFLNFNPARFGLIAPATPAGRIEWLTPPLPGWANAGEFADPRPTKPFGPLPETWGMYRRLSMYGDRVVLAYSVGAIEILESPWVEKADNATAFTRTLLVPPSPKELRMIVGGADLKVHLLGDGARIERRDNVLALVVPPHGSRLRLKVLIAAPGTDETAFASLGAVSPPPADLESWTKGGPARWTEKIVTEGVLSKDTGPYVVDTLTLPFANPYRALLFTSGHDFFSNGDAAVCTAHGDVWLVSGIDESLRRLTWKRFATGLFQPLGLKIVADSVYVLGRDQITRLRDLNDDGEADVYENFNNRGQVTANAHEFATCLETDSKGNFYYLRGDSESKTEHDGCLLRVSPDGTSLEVVASGVRNGNGLAIGPGDVITVSPQEGTWTPASAICEVKEGGFYGAMQAHHRVRPPTSYDPPLCWLPRMQDNSSGGQCWVTSDRWGPLTGQLLHFSFGRCKAFLVLREMPGGISQGGTIELPLNFDSGVMRGRFRPQDGQLYVTGLKGWVSSAVQDGCFQRVRYAGGAVPLPTSLRVLGNGIAISFAEPLETSTSEDPDNFNVEQWNYRWTSNYGSPEYSVRDPNQEGRDPVTVRSATLLDPQTVFLEIPGISPVMQMGIRYTLRSAEGTELAGTIYNTINALGRESIPADTLTPPPTNDRLPPEVAERLAPGLLTEIATSGKDPITVRARLPALAFSAETGERSSRTYRGYLQVPLKASYQFHIGGTGSSDLRINDQQVVLDTPVTLRKGFNRFTLDYRPAASGPVDLDVHWQTEGIADEPIPPTAFFFDPADPNWIENRGWQRGAELALTHQCTRCHQLREPIASSSVVSFHFDAPRLDRLGQRVTDHWVFDWLLSPTAHRPNAQMPQLFDAADPAKRQQAADLAAYLTMDRSEFTPPEVATSDELRERGAILYEDLGCIACHTLTATDETGHRRTSLHDVVVKYVPGALNAYLQDPTAHHPTTPMPKFRLAREEVSALVAFLLSSSDAKLPAAKELKLANAERGRPLFSSLGCAACHAENQAAKVPIQAVEAGTGCLRSTGAGKSPDFRFTAEDREALLSWLAAGQPSLPDLVASDFLIERLNCAACHARDGNPSKLATIFAEESIQGTLPEYLPDLTLAGAKLQTPWVTDLLLGKHAQATRPWLKARMPAFPGFASALSHGLALEHGCAPSEPRLEPDARLADIGAALTRKGSGFDCRECHGIGSELPTGGKETVLAPGINFLDVSSRLRSDFYHRFMLDPFRYNPRAKMPKFAEDGKHTKVTAILDGNAAAQFDAIWHYLNRLRGTTND